MKKILFIGIVLFYSLNTIAQETKFGVTAGFASISVKAKADEGISASASESGFYAGFFADIVASEKLHIQPSALYASASDANFLLIPVMAKYYVADKFNLQGGLQANLALEEETEEISNFGLGLGFGAGYDINEKFFIEARYGFELTNRYSGEEDVSVTLNPLTIGVGLKF